MIVNIGDDDRLTERFLLQSAARVLLVGERVGVCLRFGPVDLAVYAGRAPAY